MALRRSMLVTPGDRFPLLQKATASAADISFIELEDGVHESQKELGRTTTFRALTELEWRGKERVVRINPTFSPEGMADIAHLTPAKPTAILLPKVESVTEIHFADRLIGYAEEKAGLPNNTVKIWAMVETAKALLRVDEIASASPRMDGLIFGGGDLSVDLKVKRIGVGKFRRTSDFPHELLYARSRIVTAARAASIDCFDIGSVNLMDLEGLRRWAEYSAQMGFTGVLVFGPGQVQTINEVFSPPEEDLIWAKEVVERVEAAGRDAKKTVVVIDDEMVEGPIVKNARDILLRFERIQKEKDFRDA